MSTQTMNVEDGKGASRANARYIKIGAPPSRLLVFPRTQSPTLRDCIWEERLKPMKSWSELGTYGLVAMAGIALVTVFI